MPEAEFFLGGSSAINAGFYSRADQEFYAGVNWDLTARPDIKEFALSSSF